MVLDDPGNGEREVTPLQVLADGVCAVEGTVICSEDALTAVCDAVPLDATEAEESICDGLDNDCDAMVDEGCDDDADGYCDATMTVEAGSEATCVSGAGDCDDENDAVNPAGAPACDGLDNNCDGTADNLLPTTNLAVELSAPLLSGTDSSPILVAPGDDGFCIVYNGKPSASTSRYRAYFSSVTQSLNEAKTGGSDDYLEDLLFAQGTCIASIRSEDSDNTIDGELERWTKNLGTVVDAEVLTDAIYNFSDTTWTTALAVSGNLLVNAYLSNASTDAYYITVPINFSGSVIPSAAHIAGKLGKHPVLAASPVVGQFLFGSEFINSYNAFKLTVGTDAVRQDTLHISDAGAHKSIETVAGITYLSMFVDSNPPVYEIREILSNLDYGRLIEIPMGPEATFEFINRRLFAGAPAPALATFANTVEDRLQVISDDGAGGFAYVDVADSRGDLLGVRDAGNDVYEAVWMTTSGNVAASENAKLEVVQYTCH